MSRLVLLGGLIGIAIILAGCIPTATVVGTSNTPIHYAYAPGYNPPQVVYPDVPRDTDSSFRMKLND